MVEKDWRSFEMINLLFLLGCIKTQTVYVERIVEVDNIDDVTLGIELYGWCDDLRRRKEIRWELGNVDIYEERNWLNIEIRKSFPWGNIPEELEYCLSELNY